jgi:hypothetical protein
MASLARMSLALLVGALVFASGCVSRTAQTPTTSSTTPGLVPVGNGGNSTAGNTTVGPSPATLNLTKDPVDIEKSGDLAEGVALDEAWHVAPGFTAFTVELTLEGPQGSPEYTLQSHSIRLAGGDPSEVVYEEGTGGGLSLSSGPSRCIVCHDGTALEGQPGQWTFHFSAGNSVGSYSLRVHVAY